MCASCLSMEVDPLFVGPAALAKAYRFVGDPRDAQQYERLKDLAEDPHGMYDCTHCFNCIEACPKGVAPMNQIMRLRRVSGNDHHIVDRNNGDRHERRSRRSSRATACCTRPSCCRARTAATRGSASSRRPAGQELLDSLPVITRALVRRKVTPKGALLGHKIPKDDLKDVQRIFEKVGKDERYELNLYISGYDEDEARGVGQNVMAATARATVPAPCRARPARPGSRGLSHTMKVRLLARLRQPGIHPELHGSMGRSRRCSTSSSSS